MLQRTRQGMCLLVGTHCAQISGALGIVEELHDAVKNRYGNRVCGFLAVDSIENLGKNELKGRILELAKRQVCYLYY